MRLEVNEKMDVSYVWGGIGGVVFVYLKLVHDCSISHLHEHVRQHYRTNIRRQVIDVELNIFNAHDFLLNFPWSIAWHIENSTISTTYIHTRLWKMRNAAAAGEYGRTAADVWSCVCVYSNSMYGCDDVGFLEVFEENTILSCNFECKLKSIIKHSVCTYVSIQKCWSTERTYMECGHLHHIYSRPWMSCASGWRQCVIVVFRVCVARMKTPYDRERCRGK